MTERDGLRQRVFEKERGGGREGKRVGERKRELVLRPERAEAASHDVAAAYNMSCV